MDPLSIATVAPPHPLMCHARRAVAHDGLRLYDSCNQRIPGGIDAIGSVRGRRGNSAARTRMRRGRLAVTLVIIIALLFATSFISGLFGVAGGLILMGGLVHLLPVSQAMIVHGLAQFVSNFTRVVLWRRYIAWRTIWGFLAGALVAVLIFSLIQFVPSKIVVLFVLGASTLTVQLMPKGWAPKVTQRGVPFACGVAATSLQLTAGVSGTFINQFFLGAALDRRTIIATLAVIQSVLHLLKVAYFGLIAGGIDETLFPTLAVVPIVAILTGLLAGRVLERMTDRQYEWWVSRIVLTVGLYYVAESARLAFLALAEG